MFYASRTVEVLKYEENLLPAHLYLLVLISLTQKQDKKTFKLFQSRERELMNKYKYVVSLWRRVSAHICSYSLIYTVMKPLCYWKASNDVYTKCLTAFECCWRNTLWGCHEISAYLRGSY